jgi:hypothetical protein
MTNKFSDPALRLTQKMGRDSGIRNSKQIPTLGGKYLVYYSRVEISNKNVISTFEEERCMFSVNIGFCLYVKAASSQKNVILYTSQSHLFRQYL